MNTVTVRLHLLPPNPHILHKTLQILLLRHINRLQILAHLLNLRTSNNVRQTKVLVIDELLDGALYFAFEDVFAKVRFLSQRPSETDTIDGLEDVDHGADGFETASDVGLGLGHGGGDQLGEFQEEGFAFLGAFALVAEGELLVGPAAELDEVKGVLFQKSAELLGLFRLEALFLEFDRVEFDPDNEIWLRAFADLLGDLEDETSSVLQAAAVLVRPSVRSRGEELCQKIAVSTTRREGC